MLIRVILDCVFEVMGLCVKNFFYFLCFIKSHTSLARDFTSFLLSNPC